MQVKCIKNPNVCTFEDKRCDVNWAIYAVQEKLRAKSSKIPQKNKNKQQIQKLKLKHNTIQKKKVKSMFSG
jgi:hypothetical protein